MAGGIDVKYEGRFETGREETRDILVYDSTEDKWTKVGDLCRARGYHAISLVPAAVDEECILDIDC